MTGVGEQNADPRKYAEVAGFVKDAGGNWAVSIAQSAEFIKGWAEILGRKYFHKCALRC